VIEERFSKTSIAAAVLPAVLPVSVSGSSANRGGRFRKTEISDADLEAPSAYPTERHR
jgi:hypothetical protein